MKPPVLRTAEIKDEARGALLITLPVLLFANILFFGIYALLLQVEEAAVPAGEGWPMLLDFAAYFAVVLFMGVLEGGLHLLYLKNAYGQKPLLRDLFICVRWAPDKMILIRAALSGLPYLMLIPAALVLVQSRRVTPLYGILLLASFITGILLQLRFGLAYYVAMDFPDRGAKDALVRSAQLLQGRKGRLLRLHLSFIPLYLLSMLSMGVAGLWVRAYHLASTAAFYKAILKEDARG